MLNLLRFTIVFALSVLTCSVQAQQQTPEQTPEPQGDQRLAQEDAAPALQEPAQEPAATDLPEEQTEEEDALAAHGLPATPLPLDEIKAFANIFMRIKHNYVVPVSDEQLLEYAVEGMLNGLDPHSIYLRDERFEHLEEDTTGRFGGLGMEVVMEDGFVKVITPIDDTPAAEAGIQSGDIIIRIDGKTISGNSLSEATEKMRGEPGTSVTLTILRESEPDPLEFNLKRGLVNVASVRHRSLSNQIGYIRVSQFQLNTAENFRKKLTMLREKPEFAGLIIDLRNNPGGLLNSAVSIADAFIEEGVLVSTRGRIEENNQSFHATHTDMIDGKPIIVLINEGSASASEIVAGALQDHQRALVLGTESFGKGSVQTVMEVDETQAIKLTTARYYTPSGRSIQAAGIVPDVIVQRREFKTPGASIARVKERDLQGHLENENAPEESGEAEDLDDLLAADYQLNEAYNLLKGLVRFQPKPAVSDSALQAQN